MSLPSGLGTVEERFSGKQDRLVILIQDAHSAAEAQKSMRGILEFYEKQGVRLITAEGASGKMDTELFRAFPDRERLEKTFNFYLEQGELSGVAASAVLSPYESDSYGIEDKKLYEEGVGLFLQALDQQPGLLKKLEARKQKLKALKAKYYSPPLLELDSKLEAFEKKALELPQLLEYLAGLNDMRSRFPHLTDYFAEIKPVVSKDFNAEIEKAVQTVPAPDAPFQEKLQAYRTERMPPPAFAHYLSGLSEFQFSPALREAADRYGRLNRVKGPEFFEELENYISEIKAGLFRNEAERKIDVRDHRLRLMDHLIHLKLTRKEWESVASPAHISGEDFPVHFAFYRNAEAREAAFQKNILKLMDQKKAGAAVFVAGGFHSSAMARRLKESGISYVLISPAIKELPEEGLYVQHMRGEVSWKNYFTLRRGRIDLFESFTRAAVDRLLASSSLNSLKPWRDQLIRNLVVNEKAAQAKRYTRFLDEASIHSMDPSQKEALRKEWLARAGQFIAGVRGLKEKNQLNAQSVMNLAANPAGRINVVSPGAIPFVRNTFAPEIWTKSEARIAAAGKTNEELIVQAAAALAEAFREQQPNTDKLGPTLFKAYQELDFISSLADEEQSWEDPKKVGALILQSYLAKDRHIQSTLDLATRPGSRLSSYRDFYLQLSAALDRLDSARSEARATGGVADLRPPELRTLQDTRDPVFRSRLTNLRNVLRDVSRGVAGPARLTYDLTETKDFAGKLRQALTGTEFATSLSAGELKNAGRDVFEKFILEVTEQIFLPSGEFLSFHPSSRGVSLESWIIHEDTWQSSPYLETLVWFSEGHWENPQISGRPETTDGRFVFIEPAATEQEGRKEYLDLLENSAYNDPDFPIVYRIQQWIQRMRREGTIDEQRYVQEVAKPIVFGEGMHHAKDFAFAERRQKKSLQIDLSRNIALAEELLKPGSPLRGSFWPESIPAVIFDHALHFKTMSIQELSGQTANILEIMNRYAKAGKFDLAYLIFLLHFRRMSSAYLKFTRWSAMRPPGISEMEFEYHRTGDHFVNGMARSLKVPMGSWKAVFNVIERDNQVPAMVEKSMTILEDIRKASFWNDEERQNRLDSVRSEARAIEWLEFLKKTGADSKWGRRISAEGITFTFEELTALIAASPDFGNDSEGNPIPKSLRVRLGGNTLLVFYPDASRTVQLRIYSKKEAASVWTKVEIKDRDQRLSLLTAMVVGRHTTDHSWEPKRKDFGDIVWSDDLHKVEVGDPNRDYRSSNVHLYAKNNGKTFLIRDLQSSNGSFVDPSNLALEQPEPAPAEEPAAPLPGISVETILSDPSAGVLPRIPKRHRFELTAEELFNLGASNIQKFILDPQGKPYLDEKKNLVIFNGPLFYLGGEKTILTAGKLGGGPLQLNVWEVQQDGSLRFLQTEGLRAKAMIFIGSALQMDDAQIKKQFPGFSASSLKTMTQNTAVPPLEAPHAVLAWDGKVLTFMDLSNAGSFINRSQRTGLLTLQQAAVPQTQAGSIKLQTAELVLSHSHFELSRAQEPVTSTEIPKDFEFKVGPRQLKLVRVGNPVIRNQESLTFQVEIQGSLTGGHETAMYQKIGTIGITVHREEGGPAKGVPGGLEIKDLEDPKDAGLENQLKAWHEVNVAGQPFSRLNPKLRHLTIKEQIEARIQILENILKQIPAGRPSTAGARTKIDSYLNQLRRSLGDEKDADLLLSQLAVFMGNLDQTKAVIDILFPSKSIRVPGRDPQREMMLTPLHKELQPAGVEIRYGNLGGVALNSKDLAEALNAVLGSKGLNLLPSGAAVIENPIWKRVRIPFAEESVEVDYREFETLFKTLEKMLRSETRAINVSVQGVADLLLKSLRPEYGFPAGIYYQFLHPDGMPLQFPAYGIASIILNLLQKNEYSREQIRRSLKPLFYRKFEDYFGNHLTVGFFLDPVVEIIDRIVVPRIEKELEEAEYQFVLEQLEERLENGKRVSRRRSARSEARTGEPDTIQEPGLQIIAASIRDFFAEIKSKKILLSMIDSKLFQNALGELRQLEFVLNEKNEKDFGISVLKTSLHHHETVVKEFAKEGKPFYGVRSSIDALFLAVNQFKGTRSEARQALADLAVQNRWDSARSEARAVLAETPQQRAIYRADELRQAARARAVQMHRYNRELLVLFAGLKELKAAGDISAAGIVLQKIRAYAEVLHQYAGRIQPEKDSPYPLVERAEYAQIAATPEEDLKKLSAQFEEEIQNFYPLFVQAHEKQNAVQLEKLNREVIPLHRARIKTQLLQARWHLLKPRLNESVVLTLFSALERSYFRLSQEYAWRWRRAVGEAGIQKIRVMGSQDREAEVYEYGHFRIFQNPPAPGETQGKVIIVQNRWKKEKLEDGTWTYVLTPVNIELTGLDKAYRSQIHTLVGQEQDYTKILYNITSLDYAVDLLKTHGQDLPEYLKEEMQTNLAQVQRGPGGMSRGRTEQKRRASAGLTAVAASIQAGRLDEASSLLKNIQKLLEDRLTDIEHIKGGVQSRTDHLAHQIRIEETSRAAREMKLLVQQGRFEEAGRLAQLIYETYYLPVGTELSHYRKLKSAFIAIHSDLSRILTLPDAQAEEKERLSGKLIPRLNDIELQADQAMVRRMERAEVRTVEAKDFLALSKKFLSRTFSSKERTFQTLALKAYDHFSPGYFKEAGETLQNLQRQIEGLDPKHSARETLPEIDRMLAGVEALRQEKEAKAARAPQPKLEEETKTVPAPAHTPAAELVELRNIIFTEEGLFALQTNKPELKKAPEKPRAEEKPVEQMTPKEKMVKRKADAEASAAKIRLAVPETKPHDPAIDARRILDEAMLLDDLQALTMKILALKQLPFNTYTQKGREALQKTTKLHEKYFKERLAQKEKAVAEKPADGPDQKAVPKASFQQLFELISTYAGTFESTTLREEVLLILERARQSQEPAVIQQALNLLRGPFALGSARTARGKEAREMLKVLREQFSVPALPAVEKTISVQKPAFELTPEQKSAVVNVVKNIFLKQMNTKWSENFQPESFGENLKLEVQVVVPAQPKELRTFKIAMSQTGRPDRNIQGEVTAKNPPLWFLFDKITPASAEEIQKINQEPLGFGPRLFEIYQSARSEMRMPRWFASALTVFSLAGFISADLNEAWPQDKEVPVKKILPKREGLKEILGKEYPNVIFEGMDLLESEHPEIAKTLAGHIRKAFEKAKEINPAMIWNPEAGPDEPSFFDMGTSDNLKGENFLELLFQNGLEDGSDPNEKRLISFEKLNTDPDVWKTILFQMFRYQELNPQQKKIWEELRKKDAWAIGREKDPVQGLIADFQYAFGVRKRNPIDEPTIRIPFRQYAALELGTTTMLTPNPKLQLFLKRYIEGDFREEEFEETNWLLWIGVGAGILAGTGFVWWANRRFKKSLTVPPRSEARAEFAENTLHSVRTMLVMGKDGNKAYFRFLANELGFSRENISFFSPEEAAEILQSRDEEKPHLVIRPYYTTEEKDQPSYAPYAALEDIWKSKSLPGRPVMLHVPQMPPQEAFVFFLSTGPEKGQMAKFDSGLSLEQLFKNEVKPALAGQFPALFAGPESSDLSRPPQEIFDAMEFLLQVIPDEGYGEARSTLNWIWSRLENDEIFEPGLITRLHRHVLQLKEEWVEVLEERYENQPSLFREKRDALGRAITVLENAFPVRDRDEESVLEDIFRDMGDILEGLEDLGRGDTELAQALRDAGQLQSSDMDPREKIRQIRQDIRPYQDELRDLGGPDGSLVGRADVVKAFLKIFKDTRSEMRKSNALEKTDEPFLFGVHEMRPDWLIMRALGTAFLAVMKKNKTEEAEEDEIFQSARFLLQGYGFDGEDVEDEKFTELMGRLQNELKAVQKTGDTRWALTINNRRFATQVSAVDYVLDELLDVLQDPAGIRGEKLYPILEEYAAASEHWHLYQTEARWPFEKAAALLLKRDQEILLDLLNQAPVHLQNRALVDSLQRMLSAEKPEKWLEKNAPNLIGTTIYYISPETWLAAGGLGRVGQYHTIKIRELLGQDADLATIESYYWEPDPQDPAKVRPVNYEGVPVPVKNLSLFTRFNVRVSQRGRRVTVPVEVYKGFNDHGIEIYMIRDTPEAEGKPYFVRQLYKYTDRDKSTRRIPSQAEKAGRSEYIEFMSKASVKLVKKLEKIKQDNLAKQKKEYVPAVLWSNDAQTIPVSLFKRISDLFEELELTAEQKQKIAASQTLRLSDVFATDPARLKKMKDLFEEDEPARLEWLLSELKDLITGEDEAGLSDSMAHSTTHTYKNRGWENFEILSSEWAVPKRFHAHLKSVIWPSEADPSRLLNTADSANAVAAVHSQEMAVHNPESVLFGIANGDLLEKTEERLVEAMRLVTRKNVKFSGVDLNDPPVEFVPLVKQKAKALWLRNLKTFLQKKLKLSTDAVEEERLRKDLEAAAELSTQKMVNSYSGRGVDEKVDILRVFTEENLRFWASQGGQTVLYANVQPNEDSQKLFAVLKQRQDLINTEAAQHPEWGRVLIVTGWGPDEQRYLFAATDASIYVSERNPKDKWGTEAAGRTEANYGRVYSMNVTAPYIEGLFTVEGAIRNRNKPGSGNIVITPRHEETAYRKTVGDLIQDWNRAFAGKGTPEELKNYVKDLVAGRRLTQVFDAGQPGGQYVRTFNEVMGAKRYPLKTLERFAEGETSGLFYRNEWVRGILVKTLKKGAALSIEQGPGTRVNVFAVNLNGKPSLAVIGNGALEKGKKLFVEIKNERTRALQKLLLEQLGLSREGFVEIEDARTGESLGIHQVDYLLSAHIYSVPLEITGETPVRVFAFKPVVPEKLSSDETGPSAVLARTGYSLEAVQKLFNLKADAFGWYKNPESFFAQSDPGMAGFIETFLRLRAEEPSKLQESLRHHAELGDIFTYLKHMLDELPETTEPLRREINRLAQFAAGATSLEDKIQTNLQAMELADRYLQRSAAQLFKAYQKAESAGEYQELFSRVQLAKRTARYLSEEHPAVRLARTNKQGLRAFIVNENQVVLLNAGEVSYPDEKKVWKAWGTLLYEGEFQKMMDSLLPDDSYGAQAYDTKSGEKFRFYPKRQIRQNDLSVGVPGIQILGFRVSRHEALGTIPLTETNPWNRIRDSINAIRAAAESKKTRELYKILPPQKEIAALIYSAELLPAVMLLVAGLAPGMLGHIKNWDPDFFKTLAQILRDNREVMKKGTLRFAQPRDNAGDNGAITFSYAIDGGRDGKNIVFHVDFDHQLSRTDGKAWSTVRKLMSPDGLSLREDSLYTIHDLIEKVNYNPKTGRHLARHWDIGVPIRKISFNDKTIQRPYSGGIYQLRQSVKENFPTPAVKKTAVKIRPANDMQVFEFNTRAYFKEVGIRSWDEFTDAMLREIHDLGFKDLWPMGIYEESPASRDLNAFWGNVSHLAGRDSSAFAIPGYKVNMGGPEQFKAFVKRAIKIGLRVVVDFIPNHVAMDSPLIGQHPDWFIHRTTPPEVNFDNGQKQLGFTSNGEAFLDAFQKDYFKYELPDGRLIWVAHGRDAGPWGDTAQFNLLNPEVWQYFKETLFDLAELTDGGGIRADSLQVLLPREYRSRWFPYMEMSDYGNHMHAISQLVFGRAPHEGPNPFGPLFDVVKEAYPDFKVIGEVYFDQHGEWQKSSVDLTYGKYVYDWIVKGENGGWQEFKNYVLQRGYHQSISLEFLLRSYYFLEDHDQRVRVIRALAKRLYGLDRLDAEKARAGGELSEEREWALIQPFISKAVDWSKLLAVAIATIPGVPMIYAGQEQGRARHSSSADWVPPENFLDQYTETKIDGLPKFYRSLFSETQKPVFRRGGLPEEIPNTGGNEDVLAFVRRYEGEAAIVVLNPSDEKVVLKLDLSLIGQDARKVIGQETLILEPRSQFVKILKDLSGRSEVRQALRMPAVPDSRASFAVPMGLESGRSGQPPVRLALRANHDDSRSEVRTEEGGMLLTERTLDFALTRPFSEEEGAEARSLDDRYDPQYLFKRGFFSTESVNPEQASVVIWVNPSLQGEGVIETAKKDLEAFSREVSAGLFPHYEVQSIPPRRVSQTDFTEIRVDFQLQKEKVPQTPKGTLRQRMEAFEKQMQFFSEALNFALREKNRGRNVSFEQADTLQRQFEVHRAVFEQLEAEGAPKEWAEKWNYAIRRTEKQIDRIQTVAAGRRAEVRAVVDALAGIRPLLETEAQRFSTAVNAPRGEETLRALEKETRTGRSFYGFALRQWAGSVAAVMNAGSVAEALKVSSEQPKNFIIRLTKQDLERPASRSEWREFLDALSVAAALGHHVVIAVPDRSSAEKINGQLNPSFAAIGGRKVAGLRERVWAKVFPENGRYEEMAAHFSPSSQIHMILPYGEASGLGVKRLPRVDQLIVSDRTVGFSGERMAMKEPGLKVNAALLLAELTSKKTDAFLSQGPLSFIRESFLGQFSVTARLAAARKFLTAA